MQSGTLLHLALLRKISKQHPNFNFRERFINYKKKHFFGNITQDHSSLEKETEKRSPLPLVEACFNRERNKTMASREGKRQKVENITISGWSTKSIELNNDHMQEKSKNIRYDKTVQKTPRTKKTKTFRRRHFSEANNFKIKTPLPLNFQNFIPDYQFKNKYKAPAVFKPQYYPLKQASINYNIEEAQNLLPDKDSHLETFVTQKLPSYEAFITEMKLKTRIKKNKL